MSETTAKIYLITNTINNKKYVGYTTLSLAKRFSIHKSASGNCRALTYAFDKHGRENFTIELIYESHDCDYTLKVMESKFILEHSSHISTKNGYNLTWGGDGGFGREVTDEERIIKSASALNNWNGNDERRKQTSEQVKKLWEDGKFKNVPWASQWKITPPRGKSFEIKNLKKWLASKGLSGTKLNTRYVYISSRNLSQSPCSVGEFKGYKFEKLVKEKKEAIVVDESVRKHVIEQYNDKKAIRDQEKAVITREEEHLAFMIKKNAKIAKLKSDVLEHLRNGFTINKLVSILGTSYKYVNTLFEGDDEFKLLVAKTHEGVLSTERAFELYSEGLSMSKISEETGTCIANVYKMLVKHPDYKARSCKKVVPTKDVLELLYVTEKRSTTFIGERFDVSRMTVASWLKKYGIVISNSRNKNIDEKLVLEMHDNGASFYRIGKDLKISHETAKKIVIRNS